MKKRRQTSEGNLPIQQQVTDRSNLNFPFEITFQKQLEVNQDDLDNDQAKQMVQSSLNNLLQLPTILEFLYKEKYLERFARIIQEILCKYSKIQLQKFQPVFIKHLCFSFQAIAEQIYAQQFKDCSFEKHLNNSQNLEQISPKIIGIETNKSLNFSQKASLSANTSYQDEQYRRISSQLCMIDENLQKYEQQQAKKKHKVQFDLSNQNQVKIQQKLNNSLQQLNEKLLLVNQAKQTNSQKEEVKSQMFGKKIQNSSFDQKQNTGSKQLYNSDAFSRYQNVLSSFNEQSKYKKPPTSANSSVIKYKSEQEYLSQDKKHKQK